MNSPQNTYFIIKILTTIGSRVAGKPWKLSRDVAEKAEKVGILGRL